MREMRRIPPGEARALAERAAELLAADPRVKLMETDFVCRAHAVL